MDLNMAKSNSPLLFTEIILKNDLNILIAYGEFDSPAFKEQSESYKKVSICK
jgi:hypothetical protein